MGETALGEQESSRAAFLQQHSLPSSESEDDDDGFLELLDDQDLKVCAEGIGWGSQNQLCSQAAQTAPRWIFGNRRIPDWSRLEGSLKPIQIQAPGMGRSTFHKEIN